MKSRLQGHMYREGTTMTTREDLALLENSVSKSAKNILNMHMIYELHGNWHHYNIIATMSMTCVIQTNRSHRTVTILFIFFLYSSCMLCMIKYNTIDVHYHCAVQLCYTQWYAVHIIILYIHQCTCTCTLRTLLFVLIFSLFLS